MPYLLGSFFSAVSPLKEAPSVVSQKQSGQKETPLLEARVSLGSDFSTRVLRL